MQHDGQDHGVMFWFNRDEFAEQREDWQASACFEVPGADLLQDAASTRAMLSAPLGEPKVDFDVRSVYDSRPVNGYDFNFSAVTLTIGGGWKVQFQVPSGYRVVPREWEVAFDVVIPGSAVNSTASIQQNGAQLPNNGPIVIGMGTDEPIKTFFICEENTTFGIAGENTNIGGPVAEANVIVNVYGNLIPVTDVALPLSIANENKRCAA